MKRSALRRGVVPAAVVLSLTAAACGASNESSSSGSGSTGGASTGSSASASASNLSGTLSGIGSSAQQAAMQAWTVNYSKTNPSVTVNYAPQGSGAGRDAFIAGGADFAGSDAALDADEVTKADARCTGGSALDVPTYVSPIAVAFNLSGVDALNLSPDTLAGIMLGKITTWDAQEIKADNPGVSLPSTKITPVHRSDKSGTTENFTDYLHQAAPSVWTTEKSQVWSVKGGESAAKTSGVVQAITGGQGTIGYVDESQLGKLPAAKIKVGSTFTAPSAAGAAAALADSKAATGRSSGDLAIDINRTSTAQGAYPILLVSYEIFCTKYSDAAKGDLVKSFLGYVVSSEGQQAAAQTAGSAPLPEALATQAMASVQKITSGS